MGKSVGVIGSTTGKVGNLVYSISNGMQVVRVYQPNIHNPKTALQSAQRAKVNLAGRISSMVPRTAIMGLGSNNRMRRGEFLRNVLLNTQVTTLNDTFNAKIAQELVLFSKGPVVLSVTNPTFNAVANSITVTLRGSAAFSADDYAAMQTRIVVMVYDITTQDIVEVVSRVANKPAVDGYASTSLQVAHPSGYLADVYLIPMSTSDGSSVSISTDMAGKSDSDIAAALSVNRNAVVFTYGKSQYVGEASFQPND